MTTAIIGVGNLGSALARHLVAGVRHLVWDTGHGLERTQAQKSAWLVITLSVVLIVLISYRVWRIGAHGS